MTIQIKFEQFKQNFFKVDIYLHIMGYTVIAPVGDNIDAFFIGMKEFPTEKAFLITPRENMKQAKELEKKLEMFSVPVKIIPFDGALMENMFQAFGEICAVHNHDDLIVNVATGDRLSTCAALSASFANGLKAFGVMDKKPMLLPIMKMSYYNELTESKYKVLNNLGREDYVTLTELSKKTDLSISLLSYHLNGTLKYKGLVSLRLAEVKEHNKNLLIRLSEMGSLLLKGYVDCGGKPCRPESI
jgi:DNA-binding transcriptional ArsR family regulator